MVTDINRTFFTSCHRNILLSRNRFFTQIQDIEKFSAISCRYFSWEYLICKISSLLNKGEIAFLFIEGRSQPSNNFTKISPRTTSSPASFSLLAADRKSTRLNSSHLVISYAVFCLKKKNKHICPHHLFT